MSTKASSAITNFLNFSNAKTAAFVLMIIASLYHGFLLSLSGGNLCKSLLSDGSPDSSGRFRPYSCMMHVYSTNDSHTCFQSLASWDNLVRVYFVGDGRLRRLFIAFALHLNSSTFEVLGQTAGVTDIKIQLKGIDLHFYHRDELHDDTFQLFNSWGASVIQQDRFASQLDKLKSSATYPPTHLIMSMGTKTIQRYNQSDFGLLEYMSGLKHLARVLDTVKFPHAIWMLQDPVAEGLLPHHLKSITNDVIDRYNEVAVKVMKSIPGVQLWSSNRKVAMKMGFPTIAWSCHINKSVSCDHLPALSDGFLVSDEAMVENVQILLNLYCNNQMKFADGTCCRAPEPVTHVQQKCFIFYTFCVISTLLCFLYDQLLVSRGFHCHNWFRLGKLWNTLCRSNMYNTSLKMTTEPLSSSNSNGISGATNGLFYEFYELTSALSKFGAIMIYFFVCDRTTFFMKTNKGYTLMSFMLPISYCFILGLFFSGPTPRTKVLHTDITREWKGWMQLYILIYHFTGSYSNDVIFYIARFLVATYLFLSGFGHFSYFWNKPVPKLSCLRLLHFRLCFRELCAFGSAFWDILYRYFTVIYRLNFFVFGLCLVMNRTYMTYYFMPLISFWFTVTVLLMCLFPRVSGKPNSPVLVHHTQSIGCNDPGLQTSHTNLSCLSSDGVTTSRSSKSTLTFSHKSLKRTRFGGIPSQFESDDEAYSHNLDGSDNAHRPLINDLGCRRHQKALSLGTGFDLCRSVCTEDFLLNNTTHFDENDETGSNFLNDHHHQNHVNTHKNNAKFGPPWTEDLIRRFHRIIPLRIIRCQNEMNSSSINNASKFVRPDVTSFQNRITLFLSKFLLHFSHLKLSRLFFFMKLLIFIALIEVFHRCWVCFHWLFFSGYQKHLFEFHDNDTEWYYRWSFDRYSSIWGILFGFLCDWLRQAGYLNDCQDDYLNIKPIISVGNTGNIHLSDNNKNDLNLSSFRIKAMSSPLPDSMPADDSNSCSNEVLLLPKSNERFSNSKSVDRCNVIPTNCEPIGTLNRQNSMNVASTTTNSAETRTNCVPTRNINHNVDTVRLNTSSIPANSDQMDPSTRAHYCQSVCNYCPSGLIQTIIGLIGMIVSAIYVSTCPNREVFRLLQPYVCIVPIISYILIRTSFITLRRTYSIFFAWIGDISLELFVAQYHIWLSADAYGILVLLPGFPLINLALTSFIFICICHELHHLTQRLQTFIIPNSPLKLIRNAIIFVFVFHLITRPKLQIIQLH